MNRVRLRCVNHVALLVYVGKPEDAPEGLRAQR
jgi:hypothetical protein